MTLRNVNTQRLEDRVIALIESMGYRSLAACSMRKMRDVRLDDLTNWPKSTKRHDTLETITRAVGQFKREATMRRL